MSVLVPYASVIESGRLAVDLAKIEEAFVFVSDAGSVGAALLIIMITSVLAAVGFIIMQMGMFVVMLPEILAKKQFLKRRLRRVEGNQALIVLFSSAYATFRLFSGFCGLFLVWAGAILTHAASGNILNIAGLSLASLTVAMLFLGFARFSFDFLDLASEGKMKD